MAKIYYTRKETQFQRYDRQRSHYRVYFDNYHQESRYWQYQIQNTFEQMAKVIRKGI